MSGRMIFSAHEKNYLQELIERLSNEYNSTDTTPQKKKIIEVELIICWDLWMEQFENNDGEPTIASSSQEATGAELRLVHNSDQTVANNVPARILEEFTRRGQNYKMAEHREEEVHILRTKEQEWMMNASEEFYRNTAMDQLAEQLQGSNISKREATGTHFG